MRSLPGKLHPSPFLLKPVAGCITQIGKLVTLGSYKKHDRLLRTVGVGYGIFPASDLSLPDCLAEGLNIKVDLGKNHEIRVLAGPIQQFSSCCVTFFPIVGSFRSDRDS